MDSPLSPALPPEASESEGPTSRTVSDRQGGGSGAAAPLGRSRLRISRMPSGEPEIFSSIQGEGTTAGLPSVFLRLALCNLRCVWCDTAYTWDWSRYDLRAETVDLQIDEVIRRAEDLAPRNMVITGGEPLIQQRPLSLLLRSLKGRGWRVEVETNATILPLPELAALVDQWNTSPKLASSLNRAAEREVEPVLRWFARQENAYWKLVIARPEDVAEAEALVCRYAVPATRVLLMAEGVEPAAWAERSRWVAEQATRLGYRLSPRLHITLWGAERGR